MGAGPATLKSGKVNLNDDVGNSPNKSSFVILSIWILWQSLSHDDGKLTTTNNYNI